MTMSDMIDVQQASQRLEAAVRALTDSLTASPQPEEEVSTCNWEVLRALAVYQDAADRPENPAVLEWVPPLVEIEEDRDHDKVIQFATWVFSITDEQRAVSSGIRRLGDRRDEEQRLDSAADVVGALFDQEQGWPDVEAYEQMGLELELVNQSTHTMLA